MDKYLKNKISHHFPSNATTEQIYEKIIELGKAAQELQKEHQTPENLVSGCQSIMYLHCAAKEGKLFFKIASEALISRGIGAILIAIYSGETAETILKYRPSFLEELRITPSLSPSRSNGLASLYLKMQQEAVKRL